MDFNSFSISSQLLKSIEKLNFKTPTPIQEKAIPVILSGKDVIGSAKTGTGKTAAFSIPMIENLIKNSSTKALILVPTRELAAQVSQAVRSILENALKERVVLLVGGAPINRQFEKLRQKPRIIVGTPGRINDHLERRSLSLKNFNFLVLDEADRMLDMGFSIQVESIVKNMPKERQTLLFSATMSKSVERISKKYLTDPELISVETDSNLFENVNRESVFLKEDEKLDKLLEELETREGSVIVFVKTKFKAKKMASILRSKKLKADSIHGDLRHSARERSIRNFREYKYKVMVATDIAARGLDISHVEHVVNYDLPQSPEDYIHRIGRTARAGKSGNSLCFISPMEKRKWKEIGYLINPESKKSEPSQRSGNFSKSKPKKYFKNFKKKPFKKGSFSKRPRSSSNFQRSSYSQ